MRPVAIAIITFLSLSASQAALDPAELAAARELYGQRKDDEALAAYARLAAADPQNGEPAFYLGLLASRRDDMDASVKFLEQAVRLDPRNSEYHRRLGDSYGRSAQKAGVLAKLGWARKCLAAYEKAVELAPSSIDARFSLMGYYQQAPGIVGGGLDKAHAQAREIREIDAMLGRQAIAGLYVTEKKYSEAFTLYEEVLKENPGDYAALFQVGRLAAITGERLDHGADSLRKCLAAAPPSNQPGHAPAHWRLGMIKEKQGDKAAARASYEAALKLDPNFRQARESLGKLLGE